jgi:mannose-6-phosphate isomerase-like protein (cupin superfamily)
MVYTKTNYTNEESKNGLYFLRNALECEQHGVSVIDVEDGREGPAHDHAADGQEEVYLLLEGVASLTVGDDELDLEPGDAVRVDPETTRQLELLGDSLLVVTGAP